MKWRIAEGLEVLRRQLNAAFPNRSKVSDGGIGDAGHSARASDHNPDDKGIVRARDFTHDPDGGIDCHWLAKQLVKERDSRIKYIIWDKKICSSKTAPWTWRPYNGVNAHRHHLHVSVVPDNRADSVNPWDLDIAQASSLADVSDKEIDEALNSAAGTPDIPAKQPSEGATANPIIPTAENQPPIDSGQTTKIEMSDGKVKAEVSSDSSPPEKVAVEKAKPLGFFASMRTEIAGWLAGNGGVQAVTDKAEQASTWGLSPGFWKTLGWLFIGATLLYFLMRYVQWKKKKDTEDKNTELLVTANSTDTNKVTLAATEDLDKLRAEGYRIVERGG